MNRAPARASVGKRLAAAHIACLCVIAIALGWVSIRPAHAQSWRVQELVAQTIVADANQQIPLQGVKSVEQARVGDLRTLLDVYKKIESVAGVRADLRIVPSRTVNALAIARPPTVVVTTSMLHVIGDDAGLTAALIGHELAHISKRHGFIAAQKARHHARAGVAAGREVAVESGSVARGELAARQVFLALDSAFSRQQEIEADKVGTALLSQAKFHPDSTLRLFRTMIDRFGARPTEYLDSHPGLEERIVSAEPAVMDEHFRLLAERLHEARNWQRLLRATDYWLQANESAARAWYYRGVSLDALGRIGALPAFERAVALDPRISPARLALCIELFRSDRARESLLCSQHLEQMADKEAFAAQTFQHPIHVHGVRGTPAVIQERMKIVPH
ncbi:MAG: M48 family metalloprotease [Burkholderiales bacterium]